MSTSENVVDDPLQLDERGNEKWTLEEIFDALGKKKVGDAINFYCTECGTIQTKISWIKHGSLNDRRTRELKGYHECPNAKRLIEVSRGIIGVFD